MSGSEVEPAPHQAAEQMQEATDRLREQAWMVAPMTNGAAVVAAQEISTDVEA